MTIKNNIIVTGLSLLSDALEDGKGFICDYDVTWVFEHPSILIWSDSIIVTPTIFDYIQQERSPIKNGEVFSKIVHTYFRVAKEFGMVDIRNPKDVLPPEFENRAISQLKRDLNAFQKRNPSTVKSISKTKSKKPRKTLTEVSIGGHHYCEPQILSLYYSLALARIWQANLLLDEQSKLLLTNRFRSDSSKNQSMKAKAQAFSQIFNQRLPEIDILPPQAYTKCQSCQKLKDCTAERLDKVETQLRKYIKYRDYDEIQQMKAIFRQIAQRVASDVKPAEIVAEFSEVEKKLFKQIHDIFPKVSRWSNLFTIVSIPLIVIGATSAHPLIAGLGAGTAGISQVVDKYIDYLKSKNRWVCFTHKM